MDMLARERKAAQRLIDARRAQVAQATVLDEFMLRYARDLAASQPRCDYTIGQLPVLGSVTSSDIVPVYHNGQTYGVQANVLASAAPLPSLVFNVMAYGAKGDEVTDDTAAIQSCINAAVAATNGGIVYLPAGKYLISADLMLDSNIVVMGAGRYLTTLVAATNYQNYATAFPSVPNPRQSGANSYTGGMLNIDGSTKTSPIKNIAICDIGFDIRSMTQNQTNGLGTCCICQDVRPVQHARFERLYFELGANTSWFASNLGTKGFQGLQLLALGYGGASNPSYDINIADIVVHNGSGDIVIAVSGPAGGYAHDINVQNVTSIVDLNYIQDDRIAIDGNALQATSNSNLLNNVTVRDYKVYISDAVTIGNVNGVAILAGQGSTLSNILVDGVEYRGSTTGTYGSPIPSYIRNGTGYPVHQAYAAQGVVQNLIVRNVQASNSQQLVFQFNPTSTGDNSLIIDGVQLYNCYDTIAGIIVDASGGSSSVGRDQVIIRNVRMNFASDAHANAQFTYEPYGIKLLGGSPNGVAGDVVVEDIVMTGAYLPLVIQSGWPNARVNRLKTDNSPIWNWQAGNIVPTTVVLEDTPLNPNGLILSAPGSLSTSAPSTTGGQLAGGSTVYFKVTALDSQGVESGPSPEISYAVPAGTNTNQITLNWAAPNFQTPTKYNVYIGTTSNAELYYGNTASTSLAITGAVPTSGARPPSYLGQPAISSGGTWTNSYNFEVIVSVLWGTATYSSGTFSINGIAVSSAAAPANPTNFTVKPGATLGVPSWTGTVIFVMSQA